jgi:hypothetical protein
MTCIVGTAVVFESGRSTTTHFLGIDPGLDKTLLPPFHGWDEAPGAPINAAVLFQDNAWTRIAGLDLKFILEVQANHPLIKILVERRLAGTSPTGARFCKLSIVFVQERGFPTPESRLARQGFERGLAAYQRLDGNLPYFTTFYELNQDLFRPLAP